MTTRVLLMLTADLEAEGGGGIRTYVRDFVKYSPEDFDVAVVASTSDPRARPVGKWRRVTYGQRTARVLPLVHIPPDGVSPVPDLLRYVGALVIRRRQLPLAERVLQFHRPAIALLFLRHRGPMVQWLHLDPAEFSAHMKWRRAPGLLDRIEALTVPRMDYVYTPGAAVADAYRRRFPALHDRIRYSPNWFDPQRFRLPAPGERGAAREQIGGLIGEPLSDRQSVVLSVGRLHPQKDPELLLDAFARLARQRDARLLLVGTGRLAATLEQHARSTGIADRIHLLGPRTPDEVALLMRAADVLLIASHAEVSTRVALEALGSGLPVVATPVGEMRRVLEHGQTGWVVEDRRPDSLAAGLEWVLAQPRQELADAARESVADYVPEQVLGPIYELHRSLAAEFHTRR